MTYTLLTERSIIRISGEDRFKFLQGLISNDVNKLLPNEGLYACMLTPQGKYFADFFLYIDGESILLDLPDLRQEEIVKKLNIYKLRSAVNIETCPEYKVVSFLSALKAPGVFKDPRSPTLGMRGFIHESNLSKLTRNIANNPNAYDLTRIENFIAEGEKDLIFEKSFLLEYGLDSLNAIDYNKGCYVGQELVARTHHRGTIRKQIVQVESKDKLPESGTKIYAGEKKLGVMCSAVNNKGLALVRTEDTINLNHAVKITVGNQEIKLKIKEH
ncbi:MAG: hypothetical protein N4A31_00080 [Rickettsiales bacterium]|jgi:folate-binding protein YgfZ|nr:hypothetical protein [Rickettsiales bacterium]